MKHIFFIKSLNSNFTLFLSFEDGSKTNKILSQLTIDQGGHPIRLEDLQLTFQYSPSSQIFGLQEVKEIHFANFLSSIWL